jgi:hypothetical protein
MIRRALMVAAAAFVVGCNSGPSQTPDNTVGGANIVSSVQAPLKKGATSLSLDWGSKAQAGQVAIADVLSYGGKKPTITAPAGWQLIRDDSTPTTRQSLYWHAIEAKEPGTPTWTFSEPVDAQGAVLLLDNVAAGAPVDMASGNAGNGGALTAKSVATTGDGDLILAFFATDFGGPGLSPAMPANVSSVLDRESTAHEYWILADYQSQNGNTDELVSNTAQLFNWVAAQVTIKPGAATPSAS